MISAWTMFTEVIKDDEYESYINGTVHKLYEIMDEDKPIITNMNDSGGEVLLAIIIYKGLAIKYVLVC